MGLSPICAIFSTFSMEMYHYIVRNGSASWGNFLESNFEFSHLLIRGLVEGLSPNQANFSTSTIEVHYYIVHSDCKLQEKFFESIVYILRPSNHGLIKAIFSSFPIEMYHSVHFGSKAERIFEKAFWNFHTC